jgi:predicted phage terminase large subunit-like protein
VLDINPGVEKEWWQVKGELCFPERFPVWVVERDKKAMGPHAVAGQFQQLPAPRGGAIIKDEWWQRWGPENPKGMPWPPFSILVAYFDGASTLKLSGDPSAMAVMGVFNDVYVNPSGEEDYRPDGMFQAPFGPQRVMTGAPKVMLVHCWAERMEFNDVIERIDKTCRAKRVNILLVENKATGKAVVQELHRLFANKPYSIFEVDPGRGGWNGSGDKVARCMATIPLWANGAFFAPNTEWAEEARLEMMMFPRGAHDDRVDCIIGVMTYLRENNMLMLRDEYLERENDIAFAEDERDRAVPLYRA